MGTARVLAPQGDRNRLEPGSEKKTRRTAISLRPVLKYGHPTLRRKAEVLDMAELAECKALVDDMFETMYDEPGIGLAAPQVGVSKRLVVLAAVADDDAGENVLPPMVLVNPEITHFSQDKAPYEEGCLSVPGITEVVERPSGISFRYFDLEGQRHERDARGLLARVVQHEIDHLDGVLFVDRLPLITRQLLRKRLKNIAASTGS